MKQRRVAVDVGGHIGLWSMWMVQEFEHVHAFEPNALLHECFEANVDMSNCTLHKVALGEAQGNIRIEYPKQQVGFGHVGGEGDIPMIPLDELELTDVDFVKIDVEGYEWQVIQGARETLLRCKPIVICENKGNDQRHFGGKHDAIKLLSKMGAKVHRDISGDVIMGW